MAEKGIRGRICQTTFMLHSYVKGNNKDFDKNKDLSYLKYMEINNLYGWATLQKLPAVRFELVEKTSQFNEYFIKGYNK